MVSSASPSPALQSWLSHGALSAVLTPAVGDPRTPTAASEPSCIESYTARPIVHDLHPAFRSPLPESHFQKRFEIPANSPMFLSFFGVQSASPWTARPCVCAFVCVCVWCVCVSTDEAWSYVEEDTCMSYEEEDTCMSYEEEDVCLFFHG